MYSKEYDIGVHYIEYVLLCLVGANRDPPNKHACSDHMIRQQLKLYLSQCCAVTGIAARHIITFPKWNIILNVFFLFKFM